MKQTESVSGSSETSPKSESHFICKSFISTVRYCRRSIVSLFDLIVCMISVGILIVHRSNSGNWNDLKIKNVRTEMRAV